MITFTDIQAILDAIADHATDDIEGPTCPHKRFWRINRDDFIKGEVPGIVINGITYHIKIVNANKPLESNFYKVLLADLPVTEGVNSTTILQMPEDGPYITAGDYSVQVNGVNKSGDQIKADITEWLTNGMP